VTQRRISSREFFDRLRSLRSLDERREYERELDTEPTAILAADSSGFTRTTQRHGIVQFLGLMTLAYAELIPIIKRHGGTVLSENPDNILATFDDPSDAARAASDMHAALERRNAPLPETERFSVCIGIDYGPVLRLTDNAYGDHVNRAFKIGEDIADPGETLVTEAVASALSKEGVTYIGTKQLGDAEVRLYKLNGAKD